LLVNPALCAAAKDAPFPEKKYQVPEDPPDKCNSKAIVNVADAVPNSVLVTPTELTEVLVGAMPRNSPSEPMD
jgi:hypothetical protein